AVKAIALLPVFAIACEQGQATPAPPAPPRTADVPVDANPSTMPAKTAYLTLCAPCHGANAQGYAADHAPSLVNPTFLEAATDFSLRRSIAMGRPGTSMAAYSRALGGPLDDTAIDRLVGYLRALGPEAKTLPAAGK